MDVRSWMPKPDGRIKRRNMSSDGLTEDGLAVALARELQGQLSGAWKYVSIRDHEVDGP